MAPTVMVVSSSGLIYAVIVGAWAAYLVPMWLRRQDELNEARPTERFSTAIRLLSGRGAMERRYERTRDEVPSADGTSSERPDDPERDEEPATSSSAEQVEVDVRDRAVPATEVGGPAPAGHPRPVTAARAKVLARRRRTTSLLFLAFTAGAVAAAVGGLDYLWAPAAPGILLTFYIAHLRRAERNRFEFTMDQRRAADAARRLRERSRPAEGSPTTAGRRALVEQTDHAEWVDQQRDQVPPDDGWDPVPVPLPTYVTAPVAPRTHGADLSPADPWSSTRSTPATPTPPPAAPPSSTSTPPHPSPPPTPSTAPAPPTNDQAPPPKPIHVPRRQPARVSFVARACSAVR